MDITLQSLSEKLQRHNPKLHIAYEEYSSIWYTNLLLEDQYSFEPDCLYVGATSQLSGFHPAQWPINLICVTDSPVPTQLLENTKLNIVLLDTSLSLSKIFNEIQQILMEHQHFTNNSAKLLDSLIRGKGIQQILEIGYELLGNPILIHDTGFKLIACTKNTEIDDSFWREFMTKGYCSSESVNQLIAGKFVEKVYKSRYPVLENWDMAEHEKIISNIVIGNKIVAHLLVFEYNRSFKKSDFDQVLLLCDVLSSEMQKNKSFYNTRLVMYEYFITDLLDGKIKKKDEIEERVKYLELDLKENLYVIAVDVSKFDKTNLSLSNIIDFLGDIIMNSNCVLYNEYIVILISGTGEKFLTEKKLQSLKEFLVRHNFLGGISRRFNDLGDMQKFFNQAVKAIEIGTQMDKTKNLFTYEQYIVYNFMDRYSREELRDFCHPSVLKLLDYDLQNKTQYLQSLFISISNAKGQVGSANSLHVHRNTMNYRMAKIREIMGIDLSDRNLLFHIYLSLKILVYIEELIIE